MRKLYALQREVAMVCLGLCSLFFSQSAFGSTLFEIECADPIEKMVSADSCGAFVSVPVPDPDDQCTFIAVMSEETGASTVDSIFPVGKHIVTWIVMYDNCENDTCHVKIDILDGIPPTLTVADTLFTDCSSDDVPPFASFVEYMAANGGGSDNCSLDPMTFQHLALEESTDGNFNPEIVTRYYRIADESGNFDTIPHIIKVEDNTSPELQCKPQTASISDGNPDVFLASSFVASTSDECGEIVDTLARRMGALIFSRTVEFGCEDTGDTIMVEVMVTDESGNSNTCMTEVIVNDYVPPILMSGLPDITISCSFTFDTSDLSVFGEVDVNPLSPTEILIDDPELVPSSPYSPGNNAMVIENCPDFLTINEAYQDNRSCGTGTIVRTFTIADKNNEISFSQEIEVVDPSPFSYSDITWPRDTVYDSCNSLNTDLDVTGRPEFNITDVCSDIMTTKKDLTFDDPNSGCIVIERTWKVIDWCNYDPENEIGVWTYRQYIKVINTVPPDIFGSGEDVDVCNNADGCNGDIFLTVTATDDCTDAEDISFWYEVDIDNDGEIEIMAIGDTARVEDLDFGDHLVIWYAEDKCGNVGEYRQLVTIEDCKVPSPICFYGLSMSLGSTGEAVIWASDFNNKSNDNCTSAEDLKISFSPDVNEISKTITCSDLGTLDIEMWVTDEYGNQSFCQTYLEVQDNKGACANGGSGEEETDEDENTVEMAMIAGKVITENNSAIQDVQLNIGGPEMEDYKMTDATGKYEFNDLKTHYDYEVIPVKDDDPLAGVSTLDLVKIQRHILGLQILDSPYKLIAADINNSESLTASDLIVLRKMILGRYDNFPENNSWRFVETEYGIIEEDHPWPFIEGMYVPNLSEDIMEGDFVGVKIGDVDGTVEETFNRNRSTSRSREEYIISVDDVELLAGQPTVVHLSAREAIDLIGLQWTLSFNEDVIEIVDWQSESLGIQENDVHISKGEGLHYSLAYTALEGAHIAKNESILALKLVSKKNIKLSEVMDLGSTITEAAIYDFQESELIPVMEWNIDEGLFSLEQNNPNPFTDHTFITFSIPQDQQAQINISDASGRLLYQKRGFFNRGENTIVINAEELNFASGVVYYTLTSGSKTVTKKMIILR